jgi:hypothetical protein
MPKKTIATVTEETAEYIANVAERINLYTDFQNAIANDVKTAVKSMTSGREVAAAYRYALPFQLDVVTRETRKRKIAA